MDHTATEARWRLRVIGSRARLWDGDQELRLGAIDTVALAYLALAGPTPRARLALLLWPDAQPPRARANLRQLVHRLQRRADVVAGDPLALRGHVAVIAPGSVETAAGAGEAPVEPIDELDPDRFGELASWFRAEHERRTAAALLELERAWRAATAAADWDAALEHSRRSVVVDPHSEPWYRRLMRAQLQLGQVRDALATFERCHRWLRVDLDQAPDPATAALAQRARAQQGASPDAARSLVELAWSEHQRGRSAAAEQAAVAALDTLERSGDSPGAAEASFLLGSIARRRGDADTARAWWSLALRSSGPPPEARARLAWYLNLAMVDDGLGEATSAQRHYLMVLELAREVRDERAEAIALNNLAHLALSEARVRAARELSVAALALAERLHDEPLLAAVLEGSARAATASGDPALGRHQAARAYLLASAHGDVSVLLEATASLTRASHALGDARAARSYAQHALALARRYRHHDALVEAERNLAELGDAPVTREDAPFGVKEVDDDQATAMP